MRMGNSAPKNDFVIKPILLRSSLSSREPSSTIRTNPMVAIIGSTGLKSGNCISKNTAACFIPKPVISKRSTDGIFVLPDVSANRYETRSSIQSVMITVEVNVQCYLVVSPSACVSVKLWSTGSQSSILLPSGSKMWTNLPYSNSSISSQTVTPSTFNWVINSTMFSTR